MYRIIPYTSESREWAQINTELPITGCIQIRAEQFFDKEVQDSGYTWTDSF